MSKLARLIAQKEGYGISGDIPTTHHNPGDLRHSPHSFHTAADPGGIGEIPTDADGWADLERQLQLFAHRGMTLRAAIYAFAPPAENDSERYLEFVCAGLGLPQTATVAQALELA